MPNSKLFLPRQKSMSASKVLLIIFGVVTGLIITTGAILVVLFFFMPISGKIIMNLIEFETQNLFLIPIR